MKTINNYILEKLKVSKNHKTEYTLFPKDIFELSDMIENEIDKNGNECDLNHIDVSEITDMSYLFGNDGKDGYRLCRFNGDISGWNVSNVENMEGMFERSIFNQDISEWNVSNVKNMYAMFRESKFNGDISQWNVSNVIDMRFIFLRSTFNADISNWKFNNKCNIRGMFYNCPIEDKYKPKNLKKS